MYPHQSIEPKWQKYWAEHDTFACANPEIENGHKSKFYALDMFPYPSGAGLHVGHPKGYTATDIIARYKHAKGYHVLHPMGWDAFGLPAENYAIKTGTHPAVTTANNINRFREQLQKFGFSFDWNREVDTTDPAYFKWSQWIFLKLFEAGLAYESDKPINFCPSCKTGLANEEVVDGKCERCGTVVEKRPIRQWVLAITKYADRLLSDIDRLDWPEGIKEMQRNWIGRSEGCEFRLEGIKCPNIEVFTTRIDTVYGMTYVVIAPDHPRVTEFITSEHEKECLKYIEKTKSESDQDRTNEKKEKTGVFTGSYVINPYNEEKVPVWIADYVLGNYGTGAVMAVPAHDERDWDFAKKYDLPIKQSIAQRTQDIRNPFQKNSPIIPRNCIEGIVYNPETDKFLCLKWNKGGWVTFITGGIEEDEDAVLSAQREIMEETGFKNMVHVGQVGPLNASEYYHPFKEVNRRGIFTSHLFILSDEEQGTVQDEEHEKHQITWLSLDEIENLDDTFSTDCLPLLKKLHKQRKDWKKNAFNHTLGEKAITDDGVLVYSDIYTGTTSAEARIKLIEKAEKEGFGKKVVNYKLRDWIFSRQRYWGEPIPLIHIVEEELNKLISLNFRKPEIVDRILSKEKTIETRAMNPDELERYFGNVGVGDCLVFYDTERNQKYLAKVTKVHRWDSLGEFANDTTSFIKTCGKEASNKIEDVTNHWNTLRAGYADEVNKNGLIGFEFELLGKLYQGIDSWILPDYTLPLKLPEVEKYEPSGDGQSPLATIPAWVNVRLGDNLVGKRETNTMPQWAGSCWYYLRYMDPTNSDAIVDPAVVKYWGEVDSYIGGAEHAVLHLLYARFWHKFLFDIGVVPNDEPFFKLRNVGLILGPDGEKMSKSRGNVINPDEVIEEYGADTLRMYEMSMADFSDVSPWNTKAIIGNYRLLEKIHRLVSVDETSEEFKTFLASDDMKAVKTMHKAIKKVGEDIENMKFNTAISMLNVMMNEGAPTDPETRQEWKSTLVRLLHPFAPHMAEECWSLMGNEESIYETEWPEYIEALTIDDEVMIAVQINGKLRGTYPFMRGVAVDEVRTTIESKPEIAKWLEGATILKEIFIPNKILNIVIK